MSELKPCPFCGEKAEDIEGLQKSGYDRVSCTNAVCNAEVEGPMDGGVDSSITAWNTRANLIPRWHTDMDAAKNEGTVIIECYVDFKRVVSTGGWDSHWSFEGWVYDNKRIPQGTIPVRWHPIPALPKDEK